MLGTYFYNETIRKTVTAFGTLFNNIQIRHKDNDNNTFSIMKVPLNYGPIQKFLARIEQQPELPSQIALTLPRMSFEMTSLQYDPSRKASVIQTFKAPNQVNTASKTYLPVPYNIGFQLNIASKLQDDALQILEQILPYFQPAFNVTIKILESVGELRDIPFVLENITFTDDYEGDFSQRRFIVYTLSFTAKTYMFGPISSESTPLIEKISLKYYGSTNKTNIALGSKVSIGSSITKETSYSLNEDIKIGETLFTLNTTEYLETGDCIRINDEILKITCVESATIIRVDRGVKNTVESTHLKGDVIKIVNCKTGETIKITDRYNTSTTTTFLDDFNVC